MAWYAAHIVMSVEFKNGSQDYFPVWENIVLISAESSSEAMEKARSIGRAEEGDCDGTFRWEGREASWVFGGIRKLIETEDGAQRPADCTEITYSQMRLKDKQSLAQFISGDSVNVMYEE